MKFVLIAVLACLACRLAVGKWPWELWRASARSNDQARARALLGVTRSARRSDIIEAHRRLITSVHPDRGGSNEAVHQANWARDVLFAQLGAPTIDDGRTP